MKSLRLEHHFAAAAAVCVAGMANAGVVAWENCNLLIPNNIDGLYINVESHATGTSGGATAGWDINPYSATALTFYNATGSGIMRLAGATTPSNLALGTVVGASATFGAGSASTSSTIGAWVLNGVNYFGFKFVASDGLTHYGFGSFSIGSALNGADRMITNLYYESVAGASITVAAVPAPGALALLGVAGLVSRRRR